MIETIQADWIKSEAINLENCCNDNPLKILGPHFYEEQWVIRIWMPEADEVKINFKIPVIVLFPDTCPPDSPIIFVLLSFL